MISLKKLIGILKDNRVKKGSLWGSGNIHRVKVKSKSSDHGLKQIQPQKKMVVRDDLAQMNMMQGSSWAQMISQWMAVQNPILDDFGCLHDYPIDANVPTTRIEFVGGFLDGGEIDFPTNMLPPSIYACFGDYGKTENYIGYISNDNRQVSYIHENYRVIDTPPDGS